MTRVLVCNRFRWYNLNINRSACVKCKYPNKQSMACTFLRFCDPNHTNAKYCKNCCAKFYCYTREET